jgi:predicted AlkP superfamily phosphohydrolase/phosphomutase
MEECGLRTRVLVIGLDGATFKALGPWLKNDDLPFISKLAKQGCIGNLRSFFPTLSPLEWSCFYTGKNPGKLGIFGLTHVQDGNPFKGTSKVKILNATEVGSSSLWYILSRANKKVGVINIPATYPPEEVNGFLVSGLLTPKSAKDYYYPPEIARFLKEYQIDLEFDEIGVLPDKNVDKSRLLDQLYSINKERTATILALLGEYDLDFFMVDFNEIDQMQHLYWGDTETMRSFYKEVDKNVERIYDRFSPSDVFFMSDHGFHEAESKYFYVNTWLEKMGYLKRSGGPKEKLFSWLYPIAIWASRKASIVRDIVPESIKQKVVGEYAEYQIDFTRSKAYASMWSIFISDWAQRTSDYEALRSSLKRELEEATDPANGEKVFEHIFKREELYSGPDVPDFPDLIPVPRPKYLINPVLSGIISEPCVHKPYLAGGHKSDPQGILIAYGSHIRAGRIEGAAITDLAPTILHLFGLPIPNDMDGRVLSEIFPPESKPATTRPGLAPPHDRERQKYVFSQEDEAEIEKKLRALGYLD